MLFSMLAWVLRFGLFAYGNPADGLWMIILSCIVYGMAFDFFNISGSLFVETTTSASIRSSAQGLFMMMTNGVGAFLGSKVSGYVIDTYFTLKFNSLKALCDFLNVEETHPIVKEIIGNDIKIMPDGVLTKAVSIKEWSDIWIVFSVYALVIAIAFAILFKHKHDPKQLGEVVH